MYSIVTQIIDGDTFAITPHWKWNGARGNKIRVSGFNAPEYGQPGSQEAKNRLGRILLGKLVEVFPIDLSYDRLLCDVYVGGQNLKYLLQ